MKALLYIEFNEKNKVERWTVTSQLKAVAKLIMNCEFSFTERFYADSFVSYIKIYNLTIENFFEMDFSYNDALDEVIYYYLEKFI